MALVLADRVQETTTTTGTGTVTLAGAVTGYQSFAAVGNGNTTYYTIADQTGTNWEVGIGTYTASGTTLSRTTVLASSNSGSLVNFGAGTKNVFVDYPAGKAVFQDAVGTVTIPVLIVNSTTSTTPNLTFNASNSGFTSGATVANNYLQTVIQNKSGTSGASTNYVLSNDLGTDSTYYGEFGMNSSTFTASGTFPDFYSINNGVYFSGHDGDISLGSGNGYKTYLTWGTAGQSAHVINASGAIGLSTNLGTTAATTGTSGFGTSGQAMLSAGSSAAPTWSSIVNSAVAGTGISVSGATGTVTITNSGVTSITGTSNQITASASTGGVTLSTPQSINTTASVQFGSFGVGTAASGTTGEIRATNNITAYYSDERLKTKVGDIKDPLGKVHAIRTMLYHANEVAVALGYDASIQEVGVSAQSVQAVQPEAVAPAPIDEQYLTVRYEKLVPLLIEAIKALDQKVDALAKELK